MKEIGSLGMEIYEDMFKEITRKLYGDDKDSNDSSQGLSNGIKKEDEPHTISSFSLNSLMDSSYSQGHSLSTFDDKSKVEEDQWVSSDETIPWTTSKIASYSLAQKLFRCNECECLGYLSRVAEHWLGTHANLRVFQCPQCPYASAWARCVRMHLARQHNVCPEQNGDSVTFWKESPVLEEVTNYLERLKAKVEIEQVKVEVEEDPLTFDSSQSTQAPLSSSLSDPPLTPTPPPSQPPLSPVVTHTINNSTQTSTEIPKPIELPKPILENPKRYNCAYCHYATDRRDLFTRHENIHKDEKPFYCYVCYKQFNRADHIKKHFLRMHREHQYDMAKTKRDPSNINQIPPIQTIEYNIVEIKQKPECENVRHSLPLNIPGFTGRHIKKKGSKSGEKKFLCCYCTWAGVDSWCLKRHLNTHIKPFSCSFCEYKAARAERLSLHLFKVHNKHGCTRCSFIGDDANSLAAHHATHAL